MSTDVIDEPDTGTELVSSGTALAALNASEIDIAISTAKKYPRSLTDFRREAEQMACFDEQTAKTMFYVLPKRKGSDKSIEGPSIRLAEVIASCWGNLRFGARLISIDETTVTAQGVCHDLEKNTHASIEVSRSIMTSPKNGAPRRYSNDMIQVTGRAACSIALREAIIKVIPRMYANLICEKAKKTYIGDAQSFVAKRVAMVEWFAKAGVELQIILDFLGHKGADDITVDNLITLRGLATAIQDGETTIEEAFERPGAGGARTRKVDLPAETAEPGENPAEKSADKPAEAPVSEASRKATDDVEARYAGFKRTLAECRAPGRVKSTLEAFLKDMPAETHELMRRAADERLAEIEKSKGENAKGKQGSFA